MSRAGNLMRRLERLERPAPPRTHIPVLVISGYATEGEALKVANDAVDELVVCAVNVGLGRLEPAKENACYVVLPKAAFPRETFE
jgi:hypothetical protein